MNVIDSYDKCLLGQIINSLYNDEFVWCRHKISGANFNQKTKNINVCKNVNAEKLTSINRVWIADQSMCLRLTSTIITFWSRVKE